MNGRTEKSHNSAGNALFLILIAVALFAALSYAITQSGRGSGNTTREQARLDASQILQMVSTMQTALTRMITINGCTERTISFQVGTSTNYDNTNAPADKSCHFFEAAGGNVVSSTMRTPATATKTSGGRTFGYSGSYKGNGVGTTNSDLMMGVSDLNQQTCEQLNIMLGYSGINNRTGNPSPNRFAGGYDDSGTAVTFDSTASGRISACINVSQMGGQAFASSDVTSPSYTFYSILIAR